MDFIASIEESIKDNWTIFGIAGAITMLYVAIGFKGLFNIPPAISAASGVVMLAAAAYGYMLNQGPKSGYTYYHDGYYYFG